jgi:hypothetical protein
MMVDSIILGLKDISANRIPVECIYDMAPVIVESLNLLVSDQKQAAFSGSDYVFIAGQVSGLRREHALNNFKDAEQLLHDKGYNSINPLSFTPHICSWSIAIRISTSYMFSHCNKIYLLNNWEVSKGARIQKSLADALGFSIIQFSERLFTTN